MSTGGMAQDGAALSGVWPPNLPEGLRLEVEADIGDRGFSHVTAPDPAGPVLLLSRDALVAWSGPGQVHRVPYDCLIVSRSRRRRWSIGLPLETPDAEPQPPSGVEPDTENDLREPPIVTFEVEQAFGERARDLSQRAVPGVEPGAATSLMVSGVALATVRDPGPLVAPETIGRPPPTERVVVPGPPAVRATTERSPATQRLPAVTSVGPPSVGSAVVSTVLNPIGYVRLQARDVLVPAISYGAPILIGDRVSLVAHAGDPDLLVAIPEPSSGLASQPGAGR